MQKRDKYYELRSSYNDVVTSIQVQGDATWGELAESFYDFLRACGYELDRQDLSDHFDMSVFETMTRVKKESTDGDGDAD